jgi:hypothetical protein
VLGFRVHQSTVRKNHAYRLATVAAARMLREINTCNEWHSPATGSGPVTPTATARLEFVRNDSSSGVNFGATGVTVQYWYDQPSHELRTLDPEHPSGYRTLVREVEQFTVDVQDPVARIHLQIYGLETPIEVSCQAPNM